MNIGAIDIGSNAIRLLIGTVFEFENKTKINKVSFIRVPVRLGKDVFSRGKISKTKSEKLEKTLIAFKNLMEVYDVDAYRVCATSAMRDASNGKELVEQLHQKIGVKIDIIEGSEEANLIFKTIYSQNLNLNKNYLFVDVGGGSTEVTVVVKGKKIKSKSFNIGTIRKLNEHALGDEWRSMKGWLTDNQLVGNYEMIGSGGSINKIMKLMEEKAGKDTDYDSLKTFIDHLSTFSIDERIDELGLKPDRADVIVPAGQIYLGVMRLANIQKLVVPKFGLSDGIIFDIYEKKCKPVGK